MRLTLIWDRGFGFLTNEAQLLKVLGDTGPKAMRTLLDQGLVIQKDDRYFLKSEGTLVRSFGSIKHHLNTYARFYKTEHVGKERNYVHSLTNGLNQEGIRKAREAHKAFAVVKIATPLGPKAKHTGTENEVREKIKSLGKGVRPWEPRVYSFFIDGMEVSVSLGKPPKGKKKGGPRPPLKLLREYPLSLFGMPSEDEAEHPHPAKLLLRKDNLFLGPYKQSCQALKRAGDFIYSL